jgi:hypothetical protein
MFCVLGMGQGQTFLKTSPDKSLDVPKRGVQLIWECGEESDLAAYKIYRRAMDHRVNPDLIEVEWDHIGNSSPTPRSSRGSCSFKDETAQVSVVYEYKIVAMNSSGEESDPFVITVQVPNDKPPSQVKRFRVNGFDPMPQE